MHLRGHGLSVIDWLHLSLLWDIDRLFAATATDSLLLNAIRLTALVTSVHSATAKSALIQGVFHAIPTQRIETAGGHRRSGRARQPAGQGVRGQRQCR